MSFVKSYAEIIDQIDAINPVDYAKSRNHLSGAVTKLSPYISRGVITLPQIRSRLLAKHKAKDCEKLLQELAWREYWQNVWWAKGGAIFADLRFPRTDWRHQELVTALLDATTGINAVDQAVQQLYTTGYMHNHARLWVASIACNIARAHWFPMGQWLYYHLCDGDPASNFLSWQWVAGTVVNKQYTVSQSLINVCSNQQQLNTWLSLEREDTLTMPQPAILEAHEPCALITPYPTLPDVTSVAGEVVCLYTPWTLDPEWRTEGPARRVLIIDPSWFDRFPVSDLVLEFIMRQGQTVLPKLEVWVGEASDLPGLCEARVVHRKAHPTSQSWPGTPDPRELLHPQVTDYYPSFFKYWQAVLQTAG